MADTVALLNARLAECLDLSLQARHACWNVRGPNSVALRDLFGCLHEDLDRLADSLAARVIELGEIAEGSFFSAGARSTLTVFPRCTEGSKHVLGIATSLANWRSLLRSSMARAREFGDRDTAEILTSTSRSVDRWSSLVEPYIGAA